jgi:hypothetical protein
MNQNSNMAKLIALALFVMGICLYISNPNLKKIINNFIGKNIVGSESPVVTKKAANYQYWIYLMADGTGDCRSTYNIPRLEITHLSRIIDSIHNWGGGRIWLSYFDNDSRNNPCVYLRVQAKITRPERPSSVSGETSFEAQDKLNEWRKRTANLIRDSISSEGIYLENKAEYLKQCDGILKTRVYVYDLKTNKFSDIIGGMNNAFKVIGSIPDTKPALKYLVTFSDLQHDAPDIKLEPVLDRVPVGLSIININPAPGSSKKCTEEVTEVESPERLFELVFNN